MRNATVFLAFCVALTAVLAVPTSLETHLSNNVRLTQLQEKIARLDNQQIRNVIVLRNLSAMQVRDSFSDYIKATLKITPKELLTRIHQSFLSLDTLTRQGVSKLNEIINSASPDVQKKIKAIIDDAIVQVFETFVPWMEDLGLVLPIITSNMQTHGSAADIIFALLGITLEQLVTSVADAMDQLLILLGSTMNALQSLAQEASPEVGRALVEISNNYLNQGRIVLVPILDQLRLLVDPSFARYQQDELDMLERTISYLVGFDILTAANQADTSLAQLVDLFENTRFQLSEALVNDPGMHTKVMAVYNKAMNDATQVANPIFKLLIQFNGEARKSKQFPYNLLTSLLGVNLDAFKYYAQRTATKIERTIKETSAKIFWYTISGGIEPALTVWGLLLRQLRLAEEIARPLLTTLGPLLKHKEVVSKNQLVDTKKCEWAISDGSEYNRDILIEAVSDILTFDVSNATKVFRKALENLDTLMEDALIELDIILAYGESVDVRPTILQIMNETLTDVHVGIQPMLDVLLPFLPDKSRSNVDIALDIYTGINGISLNKFTDYCSATAKQIPILTSDAMIRIEGAATAAGPEVQDKIHSLLGNIDLLTKVIMKPFLDIELRNYLFHNVYRYNRHKFVFQS